MMTADDDFEKLVGNLVKKVCNFPEAKMCSFYLASSLDKMDEESAIEAMRIICDRASKRLLEYQKALIVLADTEMFLQVMGKEKVRRLYPLSVKRDYKDVADIFSQEKPAKRYEGENELFFQYGLTTKALGERKYLARKPDPNLIDKLTYDLEPLVVRDLLKNPMLTESQVVKIAARRPNKPEILEEIFNNAKWVARYQVKLALARNPYTPPRIALGILPFLTEQDLIGAAKDQTLHESVRNRAKAILKAKSIYIKEEALSQERRYITYQIDLERAVIEPVKEAEADIEEL
ncbi:MAG: hypothetical protein QXH91_03510 [Candidatus Bathyarchaeia archaeon]